VSELNYHANSMARSLKVSRTNRVAVIITAISRTFFSPIIEGINAQASKYGYSVLIAETHDSVQQEMQLVEFFASQWVDGIILASSVNDDEQAAEYIRKLGSLHKKDIPIPVVTLEFPLNSNRVDAVSINYEKAAFDAVSTLVRQGRKQIAHVSHPAGNRIGDQRIQGYRRALRNAGLSLSDEYIVEANYTTYSGYVAMKQLFAKSLPFDAVYCANDQTAVGAMKACEEAGAAIPDAIAIMGNDDVFAASIVSPTLSSISVPKTEMGAQAMEILHERIVNGKPKMRTNIVLDYEIIERESTKKGVRNSLRFLQW